MKKTISLALLIAFLCGLCPFASADQLTDSLSTPVPFGVVHADNASALAVYKSVGSRSSTDRLKNYQLCAILSVKESDGTLWYEIRYISNSAFKEGFIKGDVFYPLTLAGLITIAADDSAGETLRSLISTLKVNAFVTATAAPTATVKPTATPKVKATATPKPASAPTSTRRRYVLNTKTMKFHLPNCTEVSRITEENRKNTTTTREALIEQGYTPCQKCNP